MRANETLDHRLLRWIVQRPLELLAGLYVLAVLWGGLVPFHFEGPAEGGVAGVFLGLPADRLHIPDMVANVAVFLPVGLLTRALLRRARWGALGSAAGAVLAGGALSLLVETAQVYCVHRTSSAVDLVCNVAGATAGALLEALFAVWVDTSSLGLRTSLERWAERVRARPVALLAQAWAAVIALAALAPFDAAISVDRLAASVRDAAMVPFARVSRLGSGIWRAPAKARAEELWQLRLDYAWTVVAYAVLGVLLYRYLVRHCRSGAVRGAVQAVVACVVLATALSVAQLGIMSRSTDVTCVLLALVGAVGGVLAADGLVGAWSPDTTSGGVFAPAGRMRLAGWGLAICLVYVAARELTPFAFDASWSVIGAQVRSIEWLPLRMYQQAKLPVAVDDLVHKVLQWVAVALLVCVYRRHRGRADHRQPVVATAAAAAAIVAVLEGLQLFLPSRNPAITDVLVAGVAAGAGVVVFRLAAAGAIAIGLLRPVDDERVIYNVEFGEASDAPQEGVPQRTDARIEPRRHEDAKNNRV
ncbi:MAG TPA: VanZ family protein [Phycisphaerae bacterium]|nr:VanZ family protein [Phycisphaerae bacterium]